MDLEQALIDQGFVEYRDPFNRTSDKTMQYWMRNSRGEKMFCLCVRLVDFSGIKNLESYNFPDLQLDWNAQLNCGTEFDPKYFNVSYSSNDIGEVFSFFVDIYYNMYCVTY